MIEKYLCIAAFLIAGILLLTSVLDLVVGFPFSQGSMVHDVIFIVAGGLICWQAFEVWRQIA